MQQVVTGVFTFDQLQVGRVYLLTDGDGLTLLDTSIPSSGKKILAQLDEAGYEARAVNRILLTHAHPDHVGSVAELIAATGASLCVPEGERAVVDGEMAVPRASGWLKPPNTIYTDMKTDAIVSDGEILPDVLGGLQAVHTPGHAPGHMAYWQPNRRILFCGDVIFNTPNMRLPFKMVTADMAENIRSIGKLARLEPEVICFGHGKPIVHNAKQRLYDFARKVGAI